MSLVCAIVALSSCSALEMSFAASLPRGRLLHQTTPSIWRLSLCRSTSEDLIATMHLNEQGGHQLWVGRSTADESVLLDARDLHAGPELDGKIEVEG